MTGRLAVVCALAAGSVACGGMVVEGDGAFGQSFRSVGAFESIEVRDGLQASVTIGGSDDLRVNADANLLDAIVTEVKDGVLVIRLAEGVSAVQSSNAVFAEVRLPTLRKLTVTDSGLVHANGSQFLPIEIVALNGSVVSLSGELNQVSLSIENARVDAGDCDIRTMTVDAKGSASASVNASESITGRIEGGAKLDVGGNPAQRAVEVVGDAQIRYDADVSSLRLR